MTRTLLISTLFALAACGASNQSTLTGTLPADADGAYALDGSNARIDGALDGDLVTFDLTDHGSVQVFVESAGTSWPLIFPADVAGTTWDATIPTFAGTIDLGDVTLVQTSLQRSADEGEDHAEAENNPLEDIDCDGDGEVDLDDDDDDDDGVSDDDDDDDDDECENDDDDDDDDDDGDDDDDDDDDDDGETESETETETETESGTTTP